MTTQVLEVRRYFPPIDEPAADLDCADAFEKAIAAGHIVFIKEAEAQAGPGVEPLPPVYRPNPATISLRVTVLHVDSIERLLTAFTSDGGWEIEVEACLDCVRRDGADYFCQYEIEISDVYR